MAPSPGQSALWGDHEWAGTHHGVLGRGCRTTDEVAIPGERRLPDGRAPHIAWVSRPTTGGQQVARRSQRLRNRAWHCEMPGRRPASVQDLGEEPLGALLFRLAEDA